MSDAEPAGPDAEAEVGSTNETKQLEERIRETLKNVIDPELGINIVDLGLVYEIDVQGSSVRIAYTLTAMGCPLGPVIEGDMHRFLSEVPGLDRVEAELMLRPPWTPDMMSEEAKAALGFL
jgi:metal-sulfur cluster biosynthetic enzyme